MKRVENYSQRCGKGLKAAIAVCDDGLLTRSPATPSSPTVASRRTPRNFVYDRRRTNGRARCQSARRPASLATRPPCLQVNQRPKQTPSYNVVAPSTDHPGVPSLYQALRLHGRRRVESNQKCCSGLVCCRIWSWFGRSDVTGHIPVSIDYCNSALIEVPA